MQQLLFFVVFTVYKQKRLSIDVSNVLTETSDTKRVNDIVSEETGVMHRWEGNISNTRKSVSSNIQTLRSRLQKRGTAEIFF